LPGIVVGSVVFNPPRISDTGRPAASVSRDSAVETARAVLALHHSHEPRIVDLAREFLRAVGKPA
jgi:hypothetical protein